MSNIDDPTEWPLPVPEQTSDNGQFSNGTELSAEADRFSSLVSDADPPTDCSDSDTIDTGSGDSSSGVQTNHQVSRRNQQRDGEHRDDDRKDERRHQTDSRPGTSPGDQVLRGMLGGAPPVEARKDTAEVTDTTARVDSISDIASAVAERVLVTDPSSGADREVRILLKGRLLGGTEVRISQSHGDILVRLTTPGSTVSQQIEPHLEELQGALSGRVNATVKVSVDVQGGDPHQGGTASSGDGGSGDGRSRNQRRIMDEWTGEDTPGGDR